MIGHTIRLDALLIIIAICAIGGLYAKGRLWKAFFFVWMGPVVLIPLWHLAVVGASVPLRFVHDAWPALGPKVESPDGLWWWIAALFLNAHLLGLLVTASLFVFYCHYERLSRDIPVGPVSISKRHPSTPTPLPSGVPISRSRRRRVGPPVLERKRSGGKKRKLRIHSPRRS